MNVVEIPISKLKPYKKNPRENNEAVPEVAASIRDFGFKVPIVIDKDNVIVTGHTRLKAAKSLGLLSVPCVVADDLNDNEIKAFRLADNKVSEKSKWDNGLLNIELDDLFDFSMEDYGFNILDDSENIADTKVADDEKDFHRDMTIKHYNLELFDAKHSQGKYQMPIIYSENFIPDDLIGFNYMMTSDNKDCGIHCFVDDYQFERLWNCPEKYIDRLSQYECFLSPDFSLYMDMPYAMKVWNVYRSRLIGQYMQDMGLIVIPTISWAEKETFDFCFDGIEKNSTVAVSTVGVKRENESFEVWKDGMDEMIKHLEPKNILVYGGEVEYDYKGINVVNYENKVTQRMKTY